MAQTVNFFGSNQIFRAPPNMPECGDLPVHSGPFEHISCWKLTPEEMEHVIRTGEIWVSVASEAHPPIAISGIPRMVSVSPLTGVPLTYRSDGLHMVPEAMEYAIQVHGDQPYGPYTHAYHLGKVVDILDEFGYGWVYQCAGWLHDVVEDTQPDRTYEERLNTIVSHFGQTVADLVWAVTALPTIDGVRQNRKARNAEMYAKLEGCPEAVPLKTADRIANMEACLAFDDEDKGGMYAKEHSTFMEKLAGMIPLPMEERLVTTFNAIIERFPSLAKYKETA